MEENRRDHHYLRTTATTGQERKKGGKGKGDKTIICYYSVTTVENQVTQATSVGGNRKDNYTTSTNHHQCGQYQTTTQHRI
eukprot:837267-Amphidinium_carterae.1